MPSSIVICCDGTWNSADQEKRKVIIKGKEVEEICVTNVLKIACRLCKRKEDGDLQIVYYDQGVGTGNLADRISSVSGNPARGSWLLMATAMTVPERSLNTS